MSLSIPGGGYRSELKTDGALPGSTRSSRTLYNLRSKAELGDEGATAVENQIESSEMPMNHPPLPVFQQAHMFVGCINVPHSEPPRLLNCDRRLRARRQFNRTRLSSTLWTAVRPKRLLCRDGHTGLVRQLSRSRCNCEVVARTCGSGMRRVATAFQAQRRKDNNTC